MRTTTRECRPQRIQRPLRGAKLILVALYERQLLCLRLGLDPVWGACTWRKPVKGIYVGRE